MRFRNVSAKARLKVSRAILELSSNLSSSHKVEVLSSLYKI